MFTYFNARRDNLFASSFADQIVKIEKSKKLLNPHDNSLDIDSVKDQIKPKMKQKYNSQFNPSFVRSNYKSPRFLSISRF